MNIYAGLLSLVEDQIGNGSLFSILEVIGAEVRRCHEFVNEAAKKNDFDYTDAAMDYAGSMIEESMGMAFLVCHVRLNAVSALIARIHEDAKQANHILTTSDGKKSSVFKIGNPIVSPTSYTQMEVINAFANYTKHNEEWLKPWEELSKPFKNTADIVSAFGATQFGPDNLRIGAQALSLTDYNPAPLGNYVTDWMKAVRSTYEAELKSLKLI